MFLIYLGIIGSVSRLEVRWCLWKKSHWNMTGKPKGELQPDTNGSPSFIVCLLPTAHPADIGKLLWIGIAELNQRGAS